MFKINHYISFKKKLITLLCIPNEKTTSITTIGKPLQYVCNNYSAENKKKYNHKYLLMVDKTVQF